MTTKSVQRAVGKHGNKVFNGLSAGAIIWLFSAFPSKDGFNEHCRQSEKIHEECNQKRARQWQRIADLELAIDRLKNRVILTKPITGDSENPYGVELTPLSYTKE